jgi:hypothetical protein
MTPNWPHDDPASLPHFLPEVSETMVFACFSHMSKFGCLCYVASMCQKTGHDTPKWPNECPNRPPEQPNKAQDGPKQIPTSENLKIQDSFRSTPRPRTPWFPNGFILFLVCLLLLYFVIFCSPLFVCRFPSCSALFEPIFLN